MACSTPGIPIRLHREGRAVINDFAADNKVFVRIKPEHYYEVTDGIERRLLVLPIAFRYDRQSCNRDQFCLEASDVLYNTKATSIEDHYHSLQGVVSIKKEAIFDYQIVHPTTAVIYCLGLKHELEDCMYPHTEITFHEQGDTTRTHIKPKAETIKSSIRSYLATKSVHEVLPPGFDGY